ncbi:MAG TPA: rhodanese-like domain-containing protein [Verrucomicrobiae bacterium]|jgi:rhodanese-related sulfurtransferase|nr:rhodanese-like domain-containing protein [Verrucomicrobiae bacterium]
MQIRPENTMKEILEAVPGALRALFRRYHLGGCASCAFPAEETLASLCQRHSLDAAEVVRHLEESQQQDDAMQITPAQLAALRQAGPVKLVDARSREEFEATRIEGALLLSQPVMQEILAHWPRTDLFVIYDHRGQHSLDAAAYFTGQGFTNVRCLRGGIDAWAKESDASMPRYRLEMTS